MKKLAGIFALIALFALPAMAQDSGVFSRLEVGAGYTYRSLDTPGPRFDMNGFNVNADYNLTDRLGVAAEFNWTQDNNTNDGDNTLYTYEAGPRLYPFGHHHITPFAQALFGAGHYNLSLSGVTADSETQFTWSAGVGADVAFTHHLALRLGPVSYERTRFFNPLVGTIPNQNNILIDAGIVYRF
jgi:opacity protein-like surface antigen